MSYKILFVDSDAERVETLRQSIEEAGHELVSCGDGEQALIHVEEDPPTLIVIDSDFTEPPAPELCRELKQSPQGATTPIVVVGGEFQSEEEAVGQLAQSGCDLLVNRPITGERLIDLCSELIENGPADAQPEGQREPETAQDRALDPAEQDSSAEDVESDKEVARQAPGEESPDGESDHEGLLDPQAVQSAMGKFDSIVEEVDEPQDSERVAARERAAARGDFSELLNEVNVDHPADYAASAADPEPGAPEAATREREATESEASSEHPAPEEGQITEQALEAALLRAFEPAPARDEGQDIDDHLDTLFSGRGRNRPAAVPAGGQALASGEPSAPVQPHDAPEPSEPSLDVSTQRVEAPVEPTSSGALLGPDTALPVSSPPAHELFDPADHIASALSTRRGGRAKSWLIAAAVAIVLLGAGALLLLRLRGGGSPEPETTAPLIATTTGDPAVPETEPDLGPVPVDGGETTDADASVEPPTRTSPAPSEPDPLATRAEPERSRPPAEPARKPTLDEAETTVKPVNPPAKAEASPEPPSPKARPETGVAATAEPPKSPPRPVQETRSVGAPVTVTTAVPTPEPRTEKEAQPDAVAETPTPDEPREPAVPLEEPSDESRSPDSASRATSLPGTTVDGAPALAGVGDETPAEATTTATPEPIAPTPEVRVPLVLEKVEPQLSPKARKKRGTVVLKVLVNEQGNISRVLVERGMPGSELEAAAISAVLRWKFQPATRNGQPIRAWTKATFVFGK